MAEGTGASWPALLAHWTAFAQASLALPRNSEGDRWRTATAPIIGLQAVTFALGDIDRLQTPADRPAAIDKAEILVRSHSGALHALWGGEPLPSELVEMIHDASVALDAARDGGVEWRVTSDRLVAEHPEDLVSELMGERFHGDLYLPVPGTVLFRGSPAAFARGPAGQTPGAAVLAAVRAFLGDVGEPARVPGLRQVFRQFDFGTGSVVRDLVAPADGPLVPGQAQLIPVIEHGSHLPVQLPIPGMSSVETVPVVFAENPEQPPPRTASEKKK